MKDLIPAIIPNLIYDTLKVPLTRTQKLELTSTKITRGDSLSINDTRDRTDNKLSIVHYYQSVVLPLHCSRHEINE